LIVRQSMRGGKVDGFISRQLPHQAFVKCDESGLHLR
jgi:hypothetical protein